MTKITIAEGRNKFGAVVKEAEQHPVEITRRGVPVAVILSMDEYRKLKGERVTFAEAYEAFKSEHDLSELAITDDLFERDQTVGRDVDFR
ncbi:MAG: type II toxin-antitoxin system Phd/YefM family antitoxin [Chloroflexota bacterium]